MKHFVFGLVVSAAAALGFGGPAQAAGRQRIRFDDNWRFTINPADRQAQGLPLTKWTWKMAPDVSSLDEVKAVGDLTSSMDLTIGQDIFGGKPGYAWVTADLGSGPVADKSRARFVHFDSVDDNCVVFLNGSRVMKHVGWNEPFEVQIDKLWKPDGPNTMAILVENTGGGGGMFRIPAIRVAVKNELPKFVNPSYSDASWRKVQLPHDYVVEGAFTPTADASHGSLATYPAWYRKTFALPTTSRGRSVWIDFDGIYRDSTVWLNGKMLGRHPSGYIGCRYDIGAVANYGTTPNVLVVRVDPRQQEGWWYEGGGIYRHVWLTIADPVHVAPWGSRVVPRPLSQTSSDTALTDVTIETDVVNQGSEVAPISVISKVSGPDGKTVTLATGTTVLSGGKSDKVIQIVRLPNAPLWSINSPKMHRVRTMIVREGKIIDSVDTMFGVRSIRFDANLGFFLNGRPVKIKGTCNHQDFAGTGTAMPDSILYWRVKKLKEMGSNAIRMSHNPPSAEFLDACDRAGMLVMEETRHLGDTTLSKSPLKTPATDLSELKSMLLRDRNHPSIIMWSMCNEEGIQGTADGARIFAAMKKVTDGLDGTRPVTSAMNGDWGKGISLVQDLQGCNYNPWGYDAFHKEWPEMPMYGSETASTVSTRGIYANDVKRGYVSAYDLNAPPWAQTAEVAWKMIAERPFVAGGYVWTGFDYKGEPTPYGWPCINSHFGIMDECGFPKDNWFYYKAWWGTEPVVHIFPHWNWAGQEGKPISVWCQSNADEVELYLNGVSMERKKMPRYGHLEWTVPYTAGALVARGYRNGKLIATDRLETAGVPVAIRLKTDRNSLQADNEDVSVVAVEIVDAKGRVVPTADNLVQFSVSGAGRVAGVGNGDPSSHEPDKASQRHAFNGLCMVLVGATDRPGKVTITATGPGLKPMSLTFVSGK